MGRYFSGDVALKILSVLVAVVLWLYVMNEQNPQVTYVVRDVPVQLKNLDYSSLALKDPSQQYFVNVKVRARRSIITGLKPEDIVAEVNLRGRMEGENMVPVSVSVPPNVELLDFSPKEIMVVLEAVIEEQIPVYVEVKGVPAEGFAAKTPLATPQAVLVKGPRSLVNSSRKAVVEADISEKNNMVIASLPVKVVDAKGNEQRGVTYRPETVEVRIPIVPVATVPVTPNIRGNPEEGYMVKEVRVEPSVVMVTGNVEVLKNINQISTEPINVSGLSQNVSVETGLQMPRGVQPFDEALSKVRVLVEIERADLKALSFTGDDISFRNLQAGLRVVPEDGEFVLTVRGPNSIIDRVDVDSFKIYADAAGLSEGEYVLKIKADVPEPYELISVEPDTVKVTIKRQ
ncbi:MAG: hypothetical protein PWP45_321 [Tepidanaerobacteraceae bacterium]|nr:hypothetical protein [Tepidanaerobacteraceae bacterium]